MTRPGTSRAEGAAGAERRREVELCLAELGLRRRVRRLAEASRPHFDASLGQRLRLASERLGPVFATFGSYLAARPDLLPLADCLELRPVEPHVAPTPAAAVERLLHEEIGAPPEAVLDAFDAAPLRCDLITQTHRARLRGGGAVLVRIVHPDLPERCGPDLALLPLLGPALQQGARPFPIERTVAEFQAALATRADLRSQAEALRVLASEERRAWSLRLPAVDLRLSTPRLLVLADASETCLEGFVGLAARLGNAAELADVARRLCLAWLHQALEGPGIAVELELRDLLLGPDGALVLADASCSRLPPSSRANLRAYLLAAAGEDPGGAGASLLREMDGAGPNAEAALRQRFRQVVPFRDGDWGTAHDGLSLAEHLFAQWRLAAELGCRPRPELVSFYRGLAGLAAAARELAPGRDALREGLGDLQLLGRLAGFAALPDAARVRQAMEKYATLFTEMPVSLDRLLSQAAGGELRLRIEVDEEQPRGRSSPTVAMGLLLALAAVVLLAWRLGSASGFLGTWADPVGGVLFVIVGALLLWVVGRRG